MMGTREAFVHTASASGDAPAMRKNYYSLRMKHKLFVILLILACTLSLVSMLILHVAYRIYDGQLYKQSAEALNLSASIAESRLRTVQKLSYNIYSDAEVQQHLQTFKDNDEPYEQYVAGLRLVEKLTAWSLSENYILSIHMIDKQGKEWFAGARTVELGEERKRYLTEQAAAANGKDVWVEPVAADSAVISAREVRSYDRLSLEPLGTLIIRIDNRKLVDPPPGTLQQYGAHSAILSGNEHIFTTIPFQPQDLGLDYRERSGYALVALHGKRYLTAYVFSGLTGWVYLNMVSYEDIFRQTSIIKTAMIAANIVVFLLVLGMGMRFVKGITSPLELLTVKMKMVESGNFDIPPASARHNDEVGRLEHDFNIMTKKINQLIEEDYKKQLQLKETEIAMLQSQIHPHFLYNTLDSIHWLAKMNKQEPIAAMIKSLGDLLRYSIHNKNMMIPVREEMQIVRDYATIQKIRYGSKLEIQIDSDHEAEQCLIPKLTLQPIVENSIRYSLNSLVDVCRIRIRSASAGEYVEIGVSDNGPGIEPELLAQLTAGEARSQGTGLGLRNIHERIRNIFGDAYGICIDSEPDVGTTVTVRLPKRGAVELV